MPLKIFVSVMCLGISNLFVDPGMLWISSFLKCRTYRTTFHVNSGFCYVLGDRRYVTDSKPPEDVELLFGAMIIVIVYTQLQ